MDKPLPPAYVNLLGTVADGKLAVDRTYAKGRESVGATWYEHALLVEGGDPAVVPLGRTAPASLTRWPDGGYDYRSPTLPALPNGVRARLLARAGNDEGVSDWTLAKAAIETQAAPVQLPPVDPGNVEPKPLPVLLGIHGAISDSSDVAKVTALLKECGWNSTRIWVDFDAGGDCQQAALDRAMAFAAAGITARIVLTPDESLKVVPIPTKAIERIKRTLDPAKVRINLVNEANWGEYWPGNDWRQAVVWAHGVAGTLKAAGFACGSPSFTGWTTAWPAWWDEMAAAGLTSNFDAVVLHAYAGTVADLRLQILTGRAIADRHGKRLDLDEWGFTKTTTVEQAAEMLPQAIADVRASADLSAYFIATKTGKQPHDAFPWCADLRGGERREGLIAAAKRANV